jgi:hypothetical protein
VVKAGFAVDRFAGDVAAFAGVAPNGFVAGFTLPAAFAFAGFAFDKAFVTFFAPNGSSSFAFGADALGIFVVSCVAVVTFMPVPSTVFMTSVVRVTCVLGVLLGGSLGSWGACRFCCRRSRFGGLL